MLSFLSQERRPPHRHLPQASRSSLPPTLYVELHDLALDDSPIWRWPARRWRDADIVVFLEFRAEGWPPTAWSGYATEGNVRWLRRTFGGWSAELGLSLPEENLDDLLRRPRASLRVVMWCPEA